MNFRKGKPKFSNSKYNIDLCEKMTQGSSGDDQKEPVSYSPLIKADLKKLCLGESNVSSKHNVKKIVRNLGGSDGPTTKIVS